MTSDAFREEIHRREKQFEEVLELIREGWLYRSDFEEAFKFAEQEELKEQRIKDALFLEELQQKREKQ